MVEIKAVRLNEMYILYHVPMFKRAHHIGRTV
jgi:hypothetical protein